MSLLIVGTVAFDGIETPFGKVDRILGGSATYIGISASYFNKTCNLVSVVGGDFDNENIELLKKHSINCDGLKLVPNQKTFFWSGKYHKNMNKRDTIETQLNVLETFTPIIPEKYQNCSYLMLANLMPSIQLEAIANLNQKPTLIITDTMNYWMDNCLSDLISVISKTDVLIINDEEAFQLSGEKNINNAAKKIQKMGPLFLIIKRGEYGAVLFSNNRVFSCPSFSVKKCIDPTGAGDTFAGAFIGHLTSTRDNSFENMTHAVIRACAMASFCVEGFGVNGLLNVGKETLTKRIETLTKIIS
tara:strand:- start:1007 stop:1912 length:906 start_codon:yes stop_codon:yes gene_type:complete